MKEKSFASTSWSLCGYLYCTKNYRFRSNTTRIYDSRDLLCKEDCNLATDQKLNLQCQEGGETEEQKDRPNESNKFQTSEDTVLCDMVCDTWKCRDERLCNGYMYGRVCLSTEYAGLIINPPFEICNDARDCFYFSSLDTNDTSEDEKGCNPDIPGIQSCISGELMRKHDQKVLIPIFNYTRCSAIVWRIQTFSSRYKLKNQEKVFISGTPYCKDYIDQTNCTDETRVAVSCHIQGHGYSTISKTMVCGKLQTRPLCQDGMDVACVSVDRACNLHKHQVCDGIEDCFSGADEKHPWCAVMTEKTCYRNYRTHRKLPIPADWLGDRMADCLDELDEKWDIQCGLTLATRRYEVSTCEDVFICRYGQTKFIRLKQLCDGIEKCIGENSICEIGRSLTSMSTFITHQTRKTKVKAIGFCLRGLEDLTRTISPCISREFNPFDEDVFGIVKRTQVSLPTKLADCRFIFGEPYVILSCLGMCANSKCPLIKPVDYRDCPLQFSRRIYTVVNRNHLTFVQRGANDYHNDFFVCLNGICINYDKVCNLWDDCGDGSDEKNCSNSFICKDNQGILPITKKCDGYPDCWDISDECNSQCSMNIINQSMLKVAAWFIGLIAVVSNAIVLYEQGYTLKDCFTAQALANKLLVIFIGVGDFIIGGYLLVIAVADSFIYDKKYCSKRFEWLASRYCSSLGVISTFGSFLSLFSLTILSILRAFKIVSGDLHQRPESRDISRKEFIMITILMISITAVVTTISSLPLLSVLEDFFVNGLVYDSSIKIFHGQIGKEKHFKVIQSYYGRSRNRTLSWKQIKNLVGSMFSNDYGNFGDKISRVDFFGNDGVCLFKFFVTADDPQRVFSMVVLAISILCFAIVTAAYITIGVITIRSSRSLLVSKGPTAHVVKKRNQKLQKKIATIIVTDFLCWVPFVLVCFLHYFGVLDATAQYGLFSIVILPLNSIINPFLYSQLIHDFASKVWKRIRSFCIAFFETLREITSSKDQKEGEGNHESTVVGNLSNIEMIPMTVIKQGETVKVDKHEDHEDGKLCTALKELEQNDQANSTTLECKAEEIQVIVKHPVEESGSQKTLTTSEEEIPKL